MDSWSKIHIIRPKSSHLKHAKQDKSSTGSQGVSNVAWIDPNSSGAHHMKQSPFEMPIGHRRDRWNYDQSQLRGTEPYFSFCE